VFLGRRPERFLKLFGAIAVAMEQRSTLGSDRVERRNLNPTGDRGLISCEAMEKPRLIVDSCVLIDSFQAGSPHRDISIEFINLVVARGDIITMPAHGWFEVWCNVRRLSEAARSYLHPLISGRMHMALELIHIDAQFIDRYANVPLPYMKASDHIFVVVAKVNEDLLVTRDEGMLKAAKAAGVNAMTPQQFLALSAGKMDESGDDPLGLL
jgi:hypothetical protein